MPEASSGGWLLAAALSACLAGMGWLALAMDAHARQVWGRAPGPVAVRMLRLAGSAALLAGLVLCLAVDHPSMAVLVWVMALAAAAAAVAFILAWRAHWLAVLVPWMRRG